MQLTLPLTVTVLILNLAPAFAWARSGWENPDFLPTLTDQPSVSIQTVNRVPIDSKTKYVSATMSINAPDGQLWYQGKLEIRGRGNSTWLLAKKPYKIKLAQKAELLGMPADKEWALLANYSDKTLIRQPLGYELGARFGLGWSPRSRDVELYLNGQYRGLYSLVETVKIAPHRMNLQELEEGDETENGISGGYLIEVNARLDDSYCFTSTLKATPFCVKEPDQLTQSQKSYIQGYLQDAEAALFSESFKDPLTGYARYIDADTFVDWYLLNELLKNNDAVFFASVLMYKDRGGRLAMGPAWDFDLAAGNVNFNGNDSPIGWWVRTSPWFMRLFEDPAFVAKVKSRWLALRKAELTSVPRWIDERAAFLRIGQSNNFQRWLILDKLVWPNPVALGTYAKEVDHLQSWLAQRIAWLDLAFSQ